MANSCLQLSGFLVSFIGWLGIVVATSTNEWVTTCKYGLNTCKKMDELGARGPWAYCVISTGLYHCVSLTQILDLPAYIQTTRALMIVGSILGLPAVGMILMSMPCISLGNEPQSSKNKRTILGGSGDGPDLTDTPVALLTVVTDNTTDAALFSPESICIVVEDEILASGSTNLADSFLLLFGFKMRLFASSTSDLIH
ncbi:claudin-11-like [Micropterus dolomieu]|uniref:claudin-11-like n=1 Tax=Micropterus dolomieu TaxID=147949 RepID=UPI001E8EB85B|nr:claudin-11-like [Micropterus dolomieu]